MPRRRTARRRALDLLYQADLMGRAPLDVLEERHALGLDIPAYAREVVRGVQERLDELDAVLGEHAQGWTVPRMAGVDRSILRLAAYEILFRDDVPTAAAISEAVATAKELSTEESSRFVNGILGRIAREGAETA